MKFSNDQLETLNTARSILKSASFDIRINVMNAEVLHDVRLKKEETLVNDALESLKALVLYAEELNK